MLCLARVLLAAWLFLLFSPPFPPALPPSLSLRSLISLSVCCHSAFPCAQHYTLFTLSSLSSFCYFSSSLSPAWYGTTAPSLSLLSLVLCYMNHCFLFPFSLSYRSGWRLISSCSPFLFGSSLPLTFACVSVFPSDISLTVPKIAEVL